MSILHQFFESHNLEIPIRLGVFCGVLLLMAAWELVAPRRQLRVDKTPRWFSNLGLMAINNLLIRLFVPIGLTGVALFAESYGWGLLNIVSLPAWLSVVACVIALDLAVYLQHVMFHAIPLLWRLHMVHHADLDFDVSTGVRFHTIEIAISFGIKAAAILLLGASALGVLIFEIMLNATAMFNHSNIRLPGLLDRLLRLVIVTPDMHRVHHSVVKNETNSNFGFNLPWWDFLLGTYRDQPARGHTQMAIGLAQCRDERVDRLPWMLISPFRGKMGGYPINRGSEVDDLE
jgi:sterol desaturase/sphingolipid hydroxylase (fatty acid hydroxylase superfamily)